MGLFLLTLNFLPSSLIGSLQTLKIELKREPGENPGRARRCNRGRTLLESHLLEDPMGKAQQVE